MRKSGNDFALGTSLNLVNQDRISHYWEGGLTNTATDTVHAYNVCGQAEQIIDTLLCWFKPWWSRNSVWGHDLFSFWPRELHCALCARDETLQRVDGLWRVRWLHVRTGIVLLLLFCIPECILWSSWLLNQSKWTPIGRQCPGEVQTGWRLLVDRCFLSNLEVAVTNIPSIESTRHHQHTIMS